MPERLQIAGPQASCHLPASSLPACSLSRSALLCCRCTACLPMHSSAAFRPPCCPAPRSAWAATVRLIRRNRRALSRGSMAANSGAATGACVCCLPAHVRFAGQPAQCRYRQKRLHCYAVPVTSGLGAQQPCLTMHASEGGPTRAAMLCLPRPAGDPRLVPMQAGAWLGKPTQVCASGLIDRPWRWAGIATCLLLCTLRRNVPLCSMCRTWRKMQYTELPAVALDASLLVHSSYGFVSDPVFAVQRNPRKIRFFQLSHDGSTLRWGWNKCAGPAGICWAVTGCAALHVLCCA